MIRIAAAIVVAFALAIMSGIIMAQGQEKVFSSPAQGFVPATHTVSQYVPDKERICAEPKGGGILSCRTVGEFRKWVAERSAK